jgi:SAM-dependent methyltransferase
MPREYLTASDPQGLRFSTKYTSRNPLAQRLVRGFLRGFDELVSAARPAGVFEIGCGEGFLSIRLARQGIRVRGVDIRREAIDIANQNATQSSLTHMLSLSHGDLYQLDPQTIDADLVICCEVLEHLPDPERALEILAATRAKRFLLSVPREPIWRLLNAARGAYLPQFGNTPGHLNHWSRTSFLRLLERHFRVDQYRCPLPWTMALCAARSTP